MGRLDNLLFYKMKIVEHYWNLCAELGKYHSLVSLFNLGDNKLKRRNRELVIFQSSEGLCVSSEFCLSLAEVHS